MRQLRHAFWSRPCLTDEASQTELPPTRFIPQQTTPAAPLPPLTAAPLRRRRLLRRWQLLQLLFLILFNISQIFKVRSAAARDRRPGLPWRGAKRVKTSAGAATCKHRCGCHCWGCHRWGSHSRCYHRWGWCQRAGQAGREPRRQPRVMLLEHAASGSMASASGAAKSSSCCSCCWRSPHCCHWRSPHCHRCCSRQRRLSAGGGARAWPAALSGPVPAPGSAAAAPAAGPTLQPTCTLPAASAP